MTQRSYHDIPMSRRDVVDALLEPTATGMDEDERRTRMEGLRASVARYDIAAWGRAVGISRYHP